MSSLNQPSTPPPLFHGLQPSAVDDTPRAMSYRPRPPPPKPLVSEQAFLTDNKTDFLAFFLGVRPNDIDTGWQEIRDSGVYDDFIEMLDTEAPSKASYARLQLGEAKYNALLQNEDQFMRYFLENLREYVIRGVGTYGRPGYSTDPQVAQFDTILFNSFQQAIPQHYGYHFDLNSPDYTECACMFPFCMQHYH